MQPESRWATIGKRLRGRWALSDGEQPVGRLKRSTLLYFGLPDYAVYLAAIPVSLYLPFVYSRDLGLELTDIGLMLLGAATYCLASPGYLPLGSGDVVELCLVLALYGIAGGNFTAISLSMKADVIDVAAMRTGNHVAGSYMAVWSLGTKLFQAIAIGMALPILALSGFDPQGENGPDELLALSLNITVIPMVLYGAAAFVIWRYPLSAQRLASLRSAFARRQARRASGLAQADVRR